MGLVQYKSYYIYDFEQEAILVADGEEHGVAYDLYAQTARKLSYDDKWAFDIALDCIRNMTDEECKRIQMEGNIPFYHFGYGVHVRNQYVHPCKLHDYLDADDISSTVEKYIYAILSPETNAFELLLAAAAEDCIEEEAMEFLNQDTSEIEGKLTKQKQVEMLIKDALLTVERRELEALKRLGEEKS